MRHLERACALRHDDLTHALEFGVYTGGSIELMRRALPQTVEVFGFDSFRGLPTDWRDAEGVLVGACESGFFSTDGVAPDIPGVTFFVGWFADTLQDYLPKGRPIGVLHVDCDLYTSTVTVLYGLDHLIVRDTIIVFDEWIYRHDARYDDHEQRAFYEWVAARDRDYELIEFDGVTDEQQIVRITR